MTMVGTLRGRAAGLLVIAGVVLVVLAAIGPSARAANIALSGWTLQGGSADWQVGPSGDSVSVVAPTPDNPQTNGEPSFFVSPFNAASTFYASITPRNEPDDDYVGFAVGYTKPINDNNCQTTPSCDTDLYLFDWKKAQEVENGNPTTDGHEGFSLMHVQGQHRMNSNNTTDHIPCFWDHQQVANSCDVLGTDFGAGKGYAFGVTYNFQITYTASQLKIVLLGNNGGADTTIFDVAPASGSFPLGRFAFYNYSQPNVDYGFATTAPSPPPSTTSTTSAAITTTTRAATQPTVGPAVSSSIVRTGPNSTAETVEITLGVLLITAGAVLTAARGRRPAGRYYA